MSRQKNEDEVFVCQRCEPRVNAASGVYEVAMNGEPILSRPIALCNSCVFKLREKEYTVKRVDVEQMRFGK